MTTPSIPTLKQCSALLSTYLRPIKADVAALAVMLFGGIGLQLWTPKILQELIDLAQSDGMSEALMRRAVLFLVLTIVGRILQLRTSYVTQDVRWRATNAMRGDLALFVTYLRPITRGIIAISNTTA